MAVSHSHSHTHAHSHLHSISPSTTRRLTLALLLTLALVVVEAFAGTLANSLALITDAAHNISDALAIGLSWWALRLALRPANDTRTFGYHRAGILVALVNGATLVGIAVIIVWEAIQRLGQPPQVQEQALVVVGIVGFVINTVTALALLQDSRKDLNVRSAFIHLSADALSIVAVVVAGIGIALFGWQWLDAAASLLIAVLILAGTWSILRETIEILLEGTPRDIDVPAMIGDILKVGGVRGVHDLHVWSISSNLRALSAHVLTDNITLSQGANLQRDINNLLLHDYGIGHSALQLESSNCESDVLYCELSPGHDRDCECLKVGNEQEGRS